MCVAAPAYVTDGSDASRAHALDQCRWFGGMVGNHVADIVSRYGADGTAVPRSLTDYIAGRKGYDYNEHQMYALAEPAFLKGLSIAPTDGRLHYMLAGTYNVQGKIELARRQYESAIERYESIVVHAARAELALLPPQH